MDSNYISRHLYHYVGSSSPSNDDANYQRLCSILNSGYLKASHEIVGSPPLGVRLKVDSVGHLLKNNYVDPNVVCFCDISVGQISRHTITYGKFALSFSREYLLNWGARPVIYIPYFRGDNLGIHGGKVHLDLSFIDEVLSKYSEEYGDIEKAQDKYHLRVLSFLKSYDGMLPFDDPKNYYMEREWRALGRVRFNKQDIQSVCMPLSYKEKFLLDFPDYNQLIIEVVE